MTQPRDLLVTATRQLAAAVGRTDADAETMLLIATQIEELVPLLEGQIREGVPRTRFEDAVGADEYTWQIDNPAMPGLRMTFVNGEARAELSEGLNHLYEGPPGLVHGGVSSMLMDCMLTSAAQHQGLPVVTASLTTSFRSPTPLERPLTLLARVDEAGSRKVRVSGEIVCDGVTTIEAQALLIVPSGGFSSEAKKELS